MAEQKKYRILCNKERFTDNVFVDIAPENGVTHDMMFYSRLQLYRMTSSQILEDCGTRSIYMTVTDGQEPEIDFSYSDPGVKKPLEHQSYMKMCDRLRPMILKTYEKMIAAGRQSTLDHIMSPIEVENYKDTLTGNKATRGAQTQTTEYARTPQEEECLRISSEFAQQQKRREACTAMHATLSKGLSPVELMRKRMSRDGD